MKAPTREKVLEVLQRVMDPEIPVISVVEMGIIRGTRWDDLTETLHVDITPTYSGCPAMKVIEEDVSRALLAAGFPHVIAHRVYSPAWTTDWITPEAKEKLRKYGIAPPGTAAESLVAIGAKPKIIACPFCSSQRTEVRSEFGATACKALYFCSECRQPFEYFKPI